MAIEAGDFRNGLTLIIDGKLYVVQEFMHVKPGKGAAILKTKMKDLRTGNIVERNFNTNTKFEQATITTKPVQYSYEAYISLWIWKHTKLMSFLLIKLAIISIIFLRVWN